jgi:hypothetical protein
MISYITNKVNFHHLYHYFGLITNYCSLQSWNWLLKHWTDCWLQQLNTTELNTDHSLITDHWILTTSNCSPQCMRITICEYSHPFAFYSWYRSFVVPEQPIFLYIFPGKNYNWRSKDNHWILLLKIIIITFARIDNRLYLIMLLHRFQPSFLIRFSVGPRTGFQAVFQYLKPEILFKETV